MQRVKLYTQRCGEVFRGRIKNPLRSSRKGFYIVVIGKFKYSPKGKSPHSLSISSSFPFQNFKPIFSHYNYSSMELNGTGFSQAFPFNFHFIPQTIPRIFPYSSHSFPLIFPGSSLTIFSFSFLALFSFLSRQLGTLTSLYEIEREPFHFHFFLQTFLLGIRRG